MYHVQWGKLLFHSVCGRRHLLCMRALLSLRHYHPVYKYILCTHTHVYWSVCVCAPALGSWKLIEKLPRRSKLGEPKSQKRNHIFCTLTQFSAPQPSSPAGPDPICGFPFVRWPFSAHKTYYIWCDTQQQWQPWPGSSVSVCVCVGVRI